MGEAVGNLAHRAGFCRRDVLLSPSWMQCEWLWQVGTSGRWSLQKGASQLVMSEVVVIGGREEVVEHSVVPLTAFAFALPRFGHLYVLDDAAGTISVWSNDAFRF